ncbi:unnamed protein product, partial [Sphacelaria rigidula]
SRWQDTLIDYFEHVGGPAAVYVRKLRGKFDFSEANVALVPSVPGKHRDEHLYKYGHMRVRKLLRKEEILGVREPKTHKIAFQVASLANVSRKP